MSSETAGQPTATDSGVDRAWREAMAQGEQDARAAHAAWRALVDALGTARSGAGLLVQLPDVEEFYETALPKTPVPIDLMRDQLDVMIGKAWVYAEVYRHHAETYRACLDRDEVVPLKY